MSVDDSRSISSAAPDASAMWWWFDATISDPNHPALVVPDGRVLTRGQLANLIQSVRDHLLSDHGVDRNDELGLVMGSGAAMAISLLGTMAAAVVAPLAPTSPADRLADDLQRLRVSRILVDHPAQPPAVLDAAGQGGVLVLTMDPFALPSRLASPGAWPYPGSYPGPADLALLLQTSGTTGQPKVVPLGHANLVASARNIARTLRLGPQDRGLSVMPLFHIHGLVGSLLTPLVAGGSVIVSRGRPRSARALTGGPGADVADGGSNTVAGHAGRLSTAGPGQAPASAAALEFFVDAPGLARSPRSPLWGTGHRGVRHDGGCKPDL